MALELSHRYPGISPRAFEHPADRAATSALQSIPMLDRVIKRLVDFGHERRYRQLLLGNAVRLGPDQLAELWMLYNQSVDILDLGEAPDLYVTQTPVVNALTIGARRPVVLVASSLVGAYDVVEVQAVLAHELGHVLAEHTTYTTALLLLADVLAGVLPGGFLTGLPIRALYTALLEWSRAAELSCDRASALVMADPLVTCRMLLRIAGGALPGLSLEAFLRQAREYVDEDDLFSRHVRFGVERSQTHPFAVRRVRELMDWVAGGDYDRLRSGQYLRQGQEAPASAEFEAAVRHYRERFSKVVEQTAGSIQRLSGQISDWLNRRGED